MCQPECTAQVGTWVVNTYLLRLWGGQAEPQQPLWLTPGWGCCPEPSIGWKCAKTTGAKQYVCTSTMISLNGLYRLRHILRWPERAHTATEQRPPTDVLWQGFQQAPRFLAVYSVYGPLGQPLVDTSSPEWSSSLAYLSHQPTLAWSLTSCGIRWWKTRWDLTTADVSTQQWALLNSTLYIGDEGLSWFIRKSPSNGTVHTGVSKCLLWRDTQ